MSKSPAPGVEDHQFEIGLEDKIKHRLAGHTVDILLEQGDTAGARAELERLLLAGTHSTKSVEASPEFFENARQKLRRRAAGLTAKKTA